MNYNYDEIQKRYGNDALFDLQKLQKKCDKEIEARKG